MANTVGPRLKTIRLQKGIRLHELALKSGYSLNTVRDIENGSDRGRKEFRAQAIRDIGAALGAPIDITKVAPSPPGRKAERTKQIWSHVSAQLYDALTLGASIAGIPLSLYIAQSLASNERSINEDFTGKL